MKEKGERYKERGSAEVYGESEGGEGEAETAEKGGVGEGGDDGGEEGAETGEGVEDFGAGSEFAREEEEGRSLFFDPSLALVLVTVSKDDASELDDPLAKFIVDFVCLRLDNPGGAFDDDDEEGEDDEEVEEGEAKEEEEEEVGRRFLRRVSNSVCMVESLSSMVWISVTKRCWFWEKVTSISDRSSLQWRSNSRARRASCLCWRLALAYSPSSSISSRRSSSSSSNGSNSEL